MRCIAQCLGALWKAPMHVDGSTWPDGLHHLGSLGYTWYVHLGPPAPPDVQIDEHWHKLSARVDQVFLQSVEFPRRIPLTPLSSIRPCCWVQVNKMHISTFIRILDSFICVRATPFWVLENLKRHQKSGHFDTSGSLITLHSRDNVILHFCDGQTERRNCAF